MERMDRTVEIKETIQLFISRTISEIINETETPRVNFIFNEEGYNLFYEVMNKPFRLSTALTPSIDEKNIIKLRKMYDRKYPTIYVKNAELFFIYLTEFTNKLVNMYKKFGEKKDSKAFLILILRRIWLRMSPSDFNNVEEFLRKQIEFVKNDLFDEYMVNKEIKLFYSYKVNMWIEQSRIWDESTKSMYFEIISETKRHILPRIMFDIIEDTCYIYGVQNKKSIEETKDKEIENLIYRLYKGKGQPNKVIALKLFIEVLKEKNITKIKVPTIQVLSHRYHELLSKEAKENFVKRWSNKNIENLSEYFKREYECDKFWYDHIVDKEDIISKLKTEDLINLIYRIVEEDSFLHITNDIDIDDILEIKINNKVKKLF